MLRRNESNVDHFCWVCGYFLPKRAFRFVSGQRLCVSCSREPEASRWVATAQCYVKRNRFYAMFDAVTVA